MIWMKIGLHFRFLEHLIPRAWQRWEQHWHGHSGLWTYLGKPQKSAMLFCWSPAQTKKTVKPREHLPRQTSRNHVPSPKKIKKNKKTSTCGNSCELHETSSNKAPLLHMPRCTRPQPPRLAAPPLPAVPAVAAAPDRAGCATLGSAPGSGRTAARHAASWCTAEWGSGWRREAIYLDCGWAWGLGWRFWKFDEMMSNHMWSTDQNGDHQPMFRDGKHILTHQNSECIELGAGSCLVLLRGIEGVGIGMDLWWLWIFDEPIPLEVKKAIL